MTGLIHLRGFIVQFVLAVLFILLIGIGLTHAYDLQNIKNFRDALTKELTTRSWVLKAESAEDDAQLTVITKADPKATISADVNNLFKHARSLEGVARTKAIEDFLASLNKTLSITFDPAKIVPLVRHYEYLGKEDSAKLLAAAKAGQNLKKLKLTKPFETVFGDLIVMYAIDHAGGLTLISHHMLDKNDFKADQLWAAAMSEMDMKMGESKAGFRKSGLYEINHPKAEYMAGNLLLSEATWEGLEKSFGEDYLLAYPHRFAIYVAKRSDKRAVEDMKSIIATASKEDHFQSGSIFERKDDAFQIMR